jgi:hypothetical protein
VVEAAADVVVVAADTMPAATRRRAAEKRILIRFEIIQLEVYRDEAYIESERVMSTKLE